MTVRDRDRGARALLQRMRGKGTVRVGIMGPEAASRHQGAEALTTAMVASFHEFGLGVPRRSWLRDYVDENLPLLQARLRNIAERVERGANLDSELERFGLQLVGEIQERISNRIDPPLAEETIRRKGSSTPLINTGQLRASITHLVTMGQARG